MEIVHRDFRLQFELRAEPGSVAALIGRSGAGKTTALRGLAGLEPLDEGVIRLNGNRLDQLPTARRPIGMVFQNYLLFPHLSARQNVAFGPRAHGVAKGTADRRAHQWLQRMGLAKHASTKPSRLSGGQAQRVALARALAVEPELLLLDEPLSALDTETRDEIRTELARHLAEFPGVCLLVSHDRTDAEALADRTLLLVDGKLSP